LGGGEAAHVHADLGDEDLGRALGDAGDAIQASLLGRERADGLLDAGTEGGDGLVEVIEVAEVLARYESPGV